MELPDWWGSNKPYKIQDCLVGMKELPDNVIDLTVTSPPYDNLRTYGRFVFDFEGIAKELYRITKEGGVVVWVVGDATIKGSETGTSFKQALYFKELGFRLHDTMIYQKNNFSNPSSTRYHQTFEYMFVFSKGKPKTFNPIKDRKNIYVGQKAHGNTRTKDGWVKNTSGKTHNEFGMRHNVWRYITAGGHMTKDKVAHQHPAIFPEKLVADHIISWSSVGDIVFDPFLGSATTLKMANNLNRIGLGFELNIDYESIIQERIGLEKEVGV